MLGYSMSDTERSPSDGGDFPEEARLRDGPMDREILLMAVEALNKQGHPEITVESAQFKSAHRGLVIDMLRECRPMPVVLDVIYRLEHN
jgi:hypothetical protein